MSSAQQEKIFGLPAQTTMRLVNVFVCTGASVVIFGAMAKILHLSWADWALKIGLTTEAIIFLIYAILPPEGHGPAGGGGTGAVIITNTTFGTGVQSLNYTEIGRAHV
jgi:hypothetical protein